MWSTRHRWRVVLAWLLLIVLAVAACQAVPADTNIQQKAPGESGRALDLFQKRFGVEEGQIQEIVVFSHPSLTVDDPKYRATVEGLMTELRALRRVESEAVSNTPLVSSTRVVSRTTTHYDVGVPRDGSPFVAQNEGGGDVTFALVNMEGDLDQAENNVGAVVDSVRQAQEASGAFKILVGGDASIEKQASEIVKQDFAFALFLNLPVTLFILVLAFGALVAASVPLALAFAAIITASGLLALISRVYPLAEVYTEVVLLMGLATGIDYSLFVLSRFRGERRAGQTRERALTAALSTSGKAVAFAGVTVLLAIAGMFLVGDPIFTSLGLSAIVVVAMAVITSVTLLPALLALLGDNVNRLSVPFLGRPGREGGGVWGFISDRVLARPALLAALTFTVLVALAVPLITLNLGFNGAKGLSDDVAAKKALLALERNFTLGLTSPAMVVIDAGEGHNIFAPQVQAQVERLVGLVEAETLSAENRDAPFGAPLQTEINNAGDTEVVDIPINADTGEDKAVDAVNHLRDDLIPSAFSNGSGRPLVTGATAATIDFRDNIIFRTPFVFAFVLGLAFTVLLVTFRSVVIAVKAIILNALSVGAAYGLLVLVFQKGWLLEGVLNFQATGIIESWLPLFLFSILFGLSMDYHMFIMGRIKEAHERGASNDEAIAIGVKATAGTITNAAAIMVAVAVIFAFTRNIGLKQFGFGLATAIFIDATVIRSILLPASMKLLGEANWYLPRWLEWLPRIRMAE
ncbi:MAG TPA: MMPL family transporter [Dehalococcoidia bacterium]|nr:MMPL family transporter [Dehalococcoidia bacterium]